MIRRLLVEIRCAATDAGYWVRPYDMIADRRRWRWQRAARCGSRVWAQLGDAERRELVAAIERKRGQR